MGKKQAEAAFKSLRAYLSRYEDGIEWLDAIHRYTVELRQSSSKTKKELAKVSDSCGVLNDKLKSISLRLYESGTKIESISQRFKAVSAENKSLKEQILMLTEEGELPDGIDNTELLYCVFQKLKSKFPLGAPPMESYENAYGRKRVSKINLDHIVSEVGADQAETIGNLVFTVCGLLNLGILIVPPIGGLMNYPELTEKQVLKIYDWVESWFTSGTERLKQRLKILQCGNSLDRDYRKTMENVHVRNRDK